MKSDTLMDAMGMIDDSIIKNAKMHSKRVTRRPLRRFVAVAAIFILCISLSIPVLAAADVDFAYNALYAISPGMAQMLKPVRMSCEDNGIRIEVISTSVRENEADIYISVQDLTDDRIDETTDLFDSYSINQPFSSTNTCQFVGYDATQKEALFLIHITQWNKDIIVGDKITFSVRDLLSHKNEFNGMLPQVSLSAINYYNSPKLQNNPEIRGYGGSMAEKWNPASVSVMMPMPEITVSPVPGVQITAMGYVDGKLHIQTHFDNILEFDNHGYVYLTDANGSHAELIYAVSFWDETHTGSYEEFLFDISPDELSSYQLSGFFVTCDTLTHGNWQVTFPLEKE